MAWRICKEIVRGEIDNRNRGRVSGEIWLAGWARPMVLELKGNAWRDLAGRRLFFTNPNPVSGIAGSIGLAENQVGTTGDMTASRKARVPSCSMEEFEQHLAKRTEFPWHWANTLYLEWFSERNGRVVVESSDFELVLEPEAAWEMTIAEENEQCLANAKALTLFVEKLGSVLSLESGRAGAEVDDDEPQSAGEARAVAEAARMDLLLDRITARLNREGDDPGLFERVLQEERERLRRERKEPPPPELTPDEEAERAAWIAEMNDIAAEALSDFEADPEKHVRSFDERRHPLVKRCRELSFQITDSIKRGGWIPDESQEEHPLREISGSCGAAAAKLAGALNSVDEEGWPPRALFAGDTLVRLKKARALLRDVIGGLDSADEENLGPREWRIAVRREVSEILAVVQHLINDVRQVLAREDED